MGEEIENEPYKQMTAGNLSLQESPKANKEIKKELQTVKH